MFSIIDNGVPEEYMALARVWSIFSCSSGVTCVLMKPVRVLCMQFAGPGFLHRPLSVATLAFQAAAQPRHSCAPNVRKLACLLLAVVFFSRILNMSDHRQSVCTYELVFVLFVHFFTCLLLFYIPHRNENIQFFFLFCLTSLSIMPLRSTPVLTNGNISSLCVAD